MLPNKGSFAIIYQGRTVYKNWFDGQQGYELAGGEKKADTGDFDDKPYKKNIFDELDYLDTSLWKIALVGEDTVNQHSCYKIRGILANGSIQIWYYDKATYYLLRKDRFNDPEKKASPRQLIFQTIRNPASCPITPRCNSALVIRRQ